MTTFPFLRAADIDDRPKELRWLIKDLWVDEGVGIIGGQPKCCKSFLALDMAVAVASGKPCLGKYAVPKSGPVLLFAAEDALDIVKRRLIGICNMVGCELDKIDIKVITIPVLKLDDEADQLSLTDTVKDLRPKLLILDPFIRIHSIDENSSGEVARLLAFLRSINRIFKVAISVVHHASKRGNTRPGQMLRGSSEFHAWGDSNLYLQRNRDEKILLTIEHRSESSKAGIALSLFERGNALALLETDVLSNPQVSNEEKIYAFVDASDGQVSLEQIREEVKMRRNTVCEIVKSLVNQNKLSKTNAGYQTLVK